MPNSVTSLYDVDENVFFGEFLLITAFHCEMDSVNVVVYIYLHAKSANYD